MAVLTIIVCLIGIWLGGYNFDHRGELVAFGFVFVSVLTVLAFFAFSNDIDF